MEPKNPIIIDGLSCDNCPEAPRCQEQQIKKEYAINQVLQDIPSEYTNIIHRLKQIIPSITRCDYVLEKQLKRKEQECKALREDKAYTDMAYEHSKEQSDRYLQTLIEIIRFIKEDKKFARYSGRPVIFARSALEKIEKILKENDIKISEVIDG